MYVKINQIQLANNSSYLTHLIPKVRLFQVDSNHPCFNLPLSTSVIKIKLSSIIKTLLLLLLLQMLFDV